ncbi:type II toxin-antitoxin system HipA family toxinoxin YjjJ [Oxalobacteraceae bacterium CAVE-383]|nr:type II toxin-antitoxin system HipA family toxinoxin YjjJ [Oxalobacteraceae bacterium CAVE-383]
MNSFPSPVEQLRAILRQQPADGTALCRQLRISQPTLSRLWKTAGPDIVRFGAARSSQYGMLRNIADIGSLIPIFRVDEEGAIAAFGELRVLQNDWYVFTPEHGGAPRLSEGLPFFLQDLRPQGFLGRLVPQRHTDLQLPPRIIDWSDDHVLIYLAKRGEDIPGDLVVGSMSYRRLLNNPVADSIPMPPGERETVYPELARLANRGDTAGSSIGGDQPKFLVNIETGNGQSHPSIVKFSPATDTPAGRRWGDLLIAEHLAAETLAAFGIPAGPSDLVFADGRVFLEVRRFDRIGERGRRPMVSLTGIDGLLGMLDRPWSDAATALADRGLLAQDQLLRVRLLDLFGALIGNTDRHPGNLALSWRLNGAFSLLPAYDMLPMMYRPNTQGEVIERTFELAVIDKLDLRQLAPAMEMATSFWNRVIADPRISDNFTQIAMAHLDAIRPRR